ncbi:MAG: hypothetical protein ACRC33_11220 [Gemmataceae bacterium]
MPTELPPATRDEFYAEATFLPETPEERRRQEERFAEMRLDPRYERFWPVLDKLRTAAGDRADPRVAG